MNNNSQPSSPRKSKRNTKVSIKEIKKWVLNQGHPFEMIVQEHFSKVGFSTIMANHYTDFETGKSREIDVTARLTTLPGHKYMFRVSICVECKFTKGKPWVIFSKEEENSEEYVLYNSLSSEHVQPMFDLFDNIEVLQPEPISPKYIGHSIVQSLKEKGQNQEDQAYAACMAAFKAAISEVEKTNKVKQYHIIYALMAIPVVVIDGQLFNCHLNNQSKAVVKEVKFGVVHWKHGNPLNQFPYIYIVTREGLSLFCNSIGKLANELMEVRKNHKDSLKTQAEEIIRHLRQIESNQ